MKLLEQSLDNLYIIKDGTHDSPKYISTSEGFPLVTSKNLKAGVIDLTDVNFINKEDYDKINQRSKVDKGDLLFAMIGTIGNPVIVDCEPKFAIKNVALFKPKSNSIEYLKHILNSKSLKRRLLNDAKGGTQRFVSLGYLRKLVIIIPENISDQLHIANILTKVENLIARRKESIRLLDEYLKSVFLEMFGDPVNNQKNFERGTIRDVVKDVKYGTSKSASELGRFAYLRMNNITTNGYMDYADIKYIDLEDTEKEKYIVKKGDLLFNRTNSKELVGKTGIYNKCDEMVIAGYLIRVRTNEKANSWYLWGYLNSLHGKQTLFGMCKAIVGMANINAQELQDIKILIPPIELQNQFAQIVEKIETLKAQYQQSLQELENLYGSLSQKAFKGELNFKDEELLMAAEQEVKYNGK